jgi:DNA repair protein SbcC/Rad50
MGLLDRFKTQPRWKHADPTIRAQGVQDLQDEEHDVLVSLARTDPDPRVRRAAVSRLGNVAVLTEVVRLETDAQVRDEAAGVLLDIALGAYEADEAASLAAVEGLTALPLADAQKQLVLVAKTARRESVSRSALERLGDDPRALGTTARRAESAETRIAALARLADPQELTATALKADYKDVALGALERIVDPQAWRLIAARAKNPAAQRRARTLLRELEAQEAAAAQAEAKRLAALEERRKAQRDLCRDVEAR